MFAFVLLNPFCYAAEAEKAKGPTITPVPSGVVITSREEVRSVKSWSKVFVTLSQPRAPEPGFLHVLGLVEEHVYLRFNRNNSQTWKLGELLLIRTRTLRDLVRTTRRTRRSPFDFVGDIGSSLFGIARTSDVVAVAKLGQKLAGRLEGVVEEQQQVIAKVNLIGKRQNEISQKIMALIEYNRETWAIIKRYWARTENRLEENEAVQRMSEILSILEHEIYAYRRTFEDGHRVRTLCETSIVNEDLLPVGMVKQIQKSRNNQYIVPAYKYYQYIEVAVLTIIDNELICILNAPILNEEKFIQYNIATFPVRKDQSYVKLYHDEKVIYGTYGGEIFFPRRCRGREPIVCEAGVIYDKSQQPCLHGMITGDINQLRQCPITFSKTAGPAHRVYSPIRNRFVVRTPEVDYHYRCAGSPPRRGHLTVGTYIIDVGPKCNFDALIWSLRGVSEDVFYYNVTLAEPKVIQPALYLIQNISEEWNQIELPPGIRELELPNITVLHQIPHRSLVSETDDLIGRFQSTPWWNYALGLCGVIVLAVTFYMIYLCRGRIRRCASQKYKVRNNQRGRMEDEGHEIEDRQVVESGLMTQVEVPPADLAVHASEEYERVPPSQLELRTREAGTQIKGNA